MSERCFEKTSWLFKNIKAISMFDFLSFDIQRKLYINVYINSYQELLLSFAKNSRVKDLVKGKSNWGREF